jgi:hypothetical protein
MILRCSQPKDSMKAIELAAINLQLCPLQHLLQRPTINLLESNLATLLAQKREMVIMGIITTDTTITTVRHLIMWGRHHTGLTRTTGLTHSPFHQMKGHTHTTGSLGVNHHREQSPEQLFRTVPHPCILWPITDIIQQIIRTVHHLM